MSVLNIHKQGLKPMYVLYGQESFLINEARKEIILNSLSSEEQELNYSVYDMSETPVDIAIDDAQTLPFLSDRRVVVLHDAYFLTGQNVKSKVEHDLKKVEAYINNPSDMTVLVFIVPYEKLDERKKIVKSLKDHAQIFHAEIMNEKMIVDWIQKRFAKNQITASSDVCHKLIQVVGTNLMMIHQEIEKLSLFCDEGEQLTTEHVKLLAYRTLEQDIFELVNKIVEKKIKDAFKIYDDLIQQKEEPIKILSLITMQFRLMYQVKVLTSAGYGQNQIATNIKVHPYRVKLALVQAKRFEEGELRHILNRLAEIDYEVKSGRIDKKMAVEFFILKMNIQD